MCLVYIEFRDGMGPGRDEPADLPRQAGRPADMNGLRENLCSEIRTSSVVHS